MPEQSRDEYVKDALLSARALLSIVGPATRPAQIELVIHKIGLALKALEQNQDTKLH